MLSELEKLVIESLRAYADRGGADAFDKAASRLVVAICALVAHERGPGCLHELLSLVHAAHHVPEDPRADVVH